MISTPVEFGKYRLERRIAFGGMAELFLATLRMEQGVEKSVVVKRILPQFGNDPVFEQMFVDEAAIAARLTHPNVVQIYDFGRIDGTYFLAMEWVDGLDFRALLRLRRERGEPLDVALVAAVGEGIARGLAYVHGFRDADGRAYNIVHRDVSPHNIMLARSGEAKVMDFGIAKAEARAGRTATGTIKGKMAYMAPEQAAGKALDHRVDQFALGVVLWESLARRRLFDGDSDLEVMRQVMACRVPPLADVARVPSELAVVVDRMLQFDREDRFNSLRDVERALATFRFSLGERGIVHLADYLPDASPGSADAAPKGTRVATPPWEESADSAPTGPVLDAPTAVAIDRPPPPRPFQSVPRSRSVGWKRGLVVLLLAAVVAVAWNISRRTNRVAAHAMPVLAATQITILSTPSGAALSIGGADTGLRTPLALPAQAGEHLRLELTLGGYEPWTEVARVGPEPMRFDVPLVAAAVAAPSAEHVPPTLEAVSPAEAARAAPSRAARGRAKLSLRTVGPWAEVFLGGRYLGSTPLSEVSIPAGRHTVTLRNPVSGSETEVVVEAERGEHVRRTVRLPGDETPKTPQ